MDSCEYKEQTTQEVICIVLHTLCEQYHLYQVSSNMASVVPDAVQTMRMSYVIANTSA